MKLSTIVTDRYALGSLAIAIGFGIGLSMTVAAQSLAGTVVQFQPPGGGAPTGTRGGASRGDRVCLRQTSGQQPIVQALAPIDSNYGLTVAERPQFFAYIPATTAQKALFVLKDDRGQTLHQQIIPIVGSGRVVLLNVAERLPALQVGKPYEWGIVILCTGRLQIDSPFTSAWIQRISPPADVLPYLGQPPSLQQVAAFGQQGIWYDMVSTLAQLQHQQQYTSIAATWSQLLQSVGLGDISTVPIE
ncbi:DUF928 domain-containing protein [Pantanalinema rosaneae CENA516]|uniref:DUF928 domain-containing protein n=1 Tax=Pantanalinema rosaneae TaxID=1620701 RepID=UPI003D6DC979